MASTALPKTKPKRLWSYDEMLAELPQTSQPLELWDGKIIMSYNPVVSLSKTRQETIATDSNRPCHGCHDRLIRSDVGQSRKQGIP